MSVNQIVIQGRIGKDAERRTTQSGDDVFNFSVATDQGFGDSKKTDWHRCVMWAKSKPQADFLSAQLVKGAIATCSGSLNYRQYESNGEKRTVAEISCRKVEAFMAQKTERQASDDPFAGGFGKGSF
jgi:single-strand DNA-binding protein